MLISILLSSGDITTKLIYLGLYIIAIILSFSIHEWAHAYAAHMMGDDTARNLGRMTLNPMAHIDPIGFILLLIVGFGWAKPVPVNPNNYTNFRKGEFIVSFAGIFMNLVLALFSALVYVLVYKFVSYSDAYFLFLFLNVLGLINVSLAVFNFIPVFPLDGSHIFDLIFGKLVGPKVIMWMHGNGRIILYVILGISFLLSRFTSFSLIGGISNWIYTGMLELFGLIFGA